MQRKPRRPKNWWLIGLLAMPLAVTGCQTRNNVAAFNKQIRMTTEAIHGGDLTEAKVYLASAQTKAADHQQKRQVQSLGKLIAGSEALMHGNVADARSQWARIQDPRLSRQVRTQAADIGVEVPMLAVSPTTNKKETK